MKNNHDFIQEELTVNLPSNKKRKVKMLFLLSLSFLLVVGANSYAIAPSHDPSTMIKGDDGRYWIFTTGDGIWCMSSSNSDFSNWKGETTPFTKTEYPSWINTAVPGFAGTFWAPDIIYMNRNYYLFYSASTFGSSRSAIGVVRTPSLANPNWEDLGMVVSSDGSSTAINTIDPAIFKDTDGKVWMSYGSWFGGLAVIEIDSISGKTIGSTTNIVGGNHMDIEAPYIVKNGDFYFYFYNRGLCCKGLESTYQIWVSKSSNVTGPYSNNRIFMETEGNRIGPGHAGYGEGKFTFHYYDGNTSNGDAKLHVTTMGWEFGWPITDVSGDDGMNSGSDTIPIPEPEIDPIWIGGPYVLDGTKDYINVEDNINTKLNDFTVAVWVNLDVIDAWSRIFDFGPNTLDYMFLTPKSADGAVRFAIKTHNSTEQQVNGTTALVAGSWQHVAVTLKGDTCILYLNGVEVGVNYNISITPRDLGSATNNRIGRSQFAADPLLDGELDEFKIYNRALSGDEIFALGSEYAKPSSIENIDETVISFINSVKIYPNPISSENLTISSDFNINSDVNIFVINSIGQVVFFKKLINHSVLNETIDVSTLPQGIYIVNVVIDKQSINKKLIVK